MSTAKKIHSTTSPKHSEHQYTWLLEEFEKLQRARLSLVNNNSTLNTVAIQPVLPAWRNLSRRQKLACFCKQIADDNCKALSLRFSLEFMHRALTSTYTVKDYIRRTLNRNFQRKLGFIPLYMFVVEFDKTAPNCFHIHGIIKYHASEQKIISNILQETALVGNNNSGFKKYCLKMHRLTNPVGWLGYISKEYRKFATNSYFSQSLTKLTQKAYYDCRAETQSIPSYLYSNL